MYKDDIKKRICEKYARLTEEKFRLIREIWKIEYEIDKINEKIKKYGLQKNLGVVQEPENDG